MQKILQALEAFDGKQTDPIAELADALPPSRANQESLLVFAEHDVANVRVGATWILREWQDTGVEYSTEVVGELVRLVGLEDHWGAQLHILQMLDECDIPKASSRKLLGGVSTLASSENKFVRAWAMSVAIHLADQHATHRQAALDLFVQSEKDEAASVQARVRKLSKHYQWLQDFRK